MVRYGLDDAGIGIEAVYLFTNVHWRAEILQRTVIHIGKVQPSIRVGSDIVERVELASVKVVQEYCPLDTLGLTYRSCYTARSVP